MIGKKRLLAHLTLSVMGVMVTSPAPAQMHSAGHHPGLPGKDGPGMGCIFRIDLI